MGRGEEGSMAPTLACPRELIWRMEGRPRGQRDTGSMLIQSPECISSSGHVCLRVCTCVFLCASVCVSE